MPREAYDKFAAAADRIASGNSAEIVEMPREERG
jgi:hypothetical protein